MYGQQLAESDLYGRLRLAVSMLIADFSFIPRDSAFHHRYALFDKKNDSDYPESIEIHVLEIPKSRQAQDSDLVDRSRFI
jgi:hypothetical protein